jgi:hypothetical protein
VDSAGNATLFRGQWGSPRSIDGHGGVTSVSCEPNSSSCDAVDKSGHVVSYGGGSWSAPQLIDPTGGGLTAVSCTVSPAGRLLCATSDVAGVPIEYIKGKWYLRPLHVYGGVTAVSCAPNALFCIAVAGGGVALEFNNYNWTPIMVGSGLSSISCVTTAFCEAVDYGGHALTLRNGKWGPPVTVDSGGSLTGVSCASSSFCAAVDAQGRALVFQGGKWGRPALVDSGGGGLWSVSCAPKSSFCIAGDVDNRALVFKDGKWSNPQKIDQGGGVLNKGLNSISCVSTRFCAAINQDDGIIYTSNWGRPVTVDNKGGNLASVSCPSSRFCVEVDFEGDDHSYSQGKWGPPRGPDAGRRLSSVSCRSATFCVAVGLQDALVYHGGLNWTDPKPVDRAGILGSVSCASTSFCIAVDLRGDALTYR